MPMTYGVDNPVLSRAPACPGRAITLPTRSARAIIVGPTREGEMTTRMLVRRGLAAAAVLFIATPLEPARAAELQVYAAGAVQSVMQAVAPDFERATGHKLQFAFGTVGALQ